MSYTTLLGCMASFSVHSKTILSLPQGVEFSQKILIKGFLTKDLHSLAMCAVSSLQNKSRVPKET
jgi:hypothetical protein